MRLLDLWRRVEGHAIRAPERLALDDGRGLTIAYGDLLGAVATECGWLRERGARVLGLLADNGIPWALTDLAALAMGITMVPLPSFFTDVQLRHIITTAGIDIVTTDDPSRVARLGFRVEPGDCSPFGLSLCRAVEPRAASHGASGLAATDGPQDAKVTFTSGTTGHPKGVRLAESPLMTVTSSLVEATACGPDDVHLAALPLSVLLENVGGLYRGIFAGARVVLPPLAAVGLSGSSELQASRLAHTLLATDATSVILVPAALEGLCSHLEGTGERLPALRFVGCGGAPIPEDVRGRARALGLPLRCGYGLSESCSVIAVETRRCHRAGSVGRPLPHVGVRIDAAGEIFVSGALFSGYLGEPDRASTQGMLATGDIGFLDDEGYLFVQGRRDRTIVTDYARNVSPDWVESALRDHPAVAEARVTRDDDGLCAVIVPTEASADDPDAVASAVAQVNAGLPDYARVARWSRAPFEDISQ